MGSKTTARLSLVYPTENTDPWFTVFEQLMQQLDAVGFAAREDRNLHLGGGGTMTWNGSTGALTWGAALTVVSPLIGGVGSITAGSATIADGQSFHVDVTRLASSNYTVAASVTDQVTGSDNALVLARRDGTNLVWRNGVIMPSGFSGTMLSALSQDIVDALEAAASPSASNPFATMADVGGAHEDLSASCNGSTTLFTVSSAYRAGSVRVMLNGLSQGVVATGNFSETTPASGKVTMTVAPLAADQLFVEYVPA